MAGREPPPPAVWRGGPQVIPRPDGWEVGNPAPWFELDAEERRLTLDQIVERMQARGPGRDLANAFAQVRGDRKSAVLCPLYEHDGEPGVILTRRSAQMRNHTREVSFPGGRYDETDESYWATALREAWEEVGLDASTVTRVGELDRFVTGGSGSLIHPYVGTLPGRPEYLVANPDEVESIRLTPLSELLADDAWREEVWTRNGSTARITFFELDGDTVWGATAAMLRSLLVTALNL